VDDGLDAEERLMAFVLLPVLVGNPVKATEFIEARDAVEERAHTVGFIPTQPPDPPVGSVITAIGHINDLRATISTIVTSTTGLIYINPTTDAPWATLAEFFTAAGIGDGTNWTRVPARKGGLTVSTTLVVGDTIFKEHINEIRLAVQQLTRVRWTVRTVLPGTQAQRLGSDTQPGSSQAIWDGVRQTAIANANAATPTLPGGTQSGFDGRGQALAFPIRRRATVSLRKLHLESNAPSVGPSAPTPITYANVRLQVDLGNVIDTNSNPPSPTGLVQVRVVTPFSALVFPPLSGSWNQGTVAASFDLTAGTKVGLSLPASSLPDFSPDRDFVLIYGIADESGDRTSWPNPPNFQTRRSDQQYNVSNLGLHVVDADITNFSFQ